MSLENLISFDPPPEMDISRLSAEDASSVIISGQQQAEVMRALQEIYATPEGRAAIERAAGASLDGKVHIMNNPGGITMALGRGIVSNTIVFGSEDDNAKYLQPSTGQYADLTIQRILYHEFHHMGHGHSMDNGQFNLRQESETIAATNVFMAKYYGEPHRSLDHSAARFGGTEGHDFNRSYSGPTPVQ